MLQLNIRKGLCLGQISTYVAYVMPSNALTVIDAEIGPSTDITWVPLSYTLASSFAFLLVGRLSDMFGRRWFFIGGNFIALLGAIVSATAQSVNALIAGTALSGLATAVQISFTVAISELVPTKHRPMWISGIFASAISINVFGPVIVQAMQIHTKPGWRWSYYLDIIITFVAVLLFYFCYHPPGFELLHKNRSRIAQLKRVDFVGTLLYTAGLILLQLGVSWGGVSYPWKSAHVISTIVTGAVALAFFIYYGEFETWTDV